MIFVVVVFSLCRPFAFAKPFGKALLHTLLKRVEAYHEVIYVKRSFLLTCEVQIDSVQAVTRESQTVVCVYLNCSGSDKAKE